MNLTCVQNRLQFVNNGNLNDQSPMIECSDIKIELKPHQKTMLHAMGVLEDGNRMTRTNLYVHSNVGVLADSTGSGKSIDILAHICNRPVYFPKEHIVEHYSNIAYFKSSEKQGCIYSNLIVVPHSCMSQWQTYITKLTDLPLTVVAKRKDIEKFVVETHSNQKGITLCSSSMYNEFVDAYYPKWTRVIFDEADSINIAAARKPNTFFTWFVTSSLQNLFFPSGSYPMQCVLPGSSRYITQRKYIDGIRRNGFIKDTFRILETDHATSLIDCIVLKNNDEFIRSSFSLPKPETNVIECRTPIYLQILIGNVNNQIINMLNAGDLQGAIDKLGCDVDTFDNITTGVTKVYTLKIENLKQQLDCESRLQFTRPHEKETQLNRIKQYQESIASYENKISSIKASLEEYEQGMCQICMDEYTNPTIVKCCQNVFCFECITRCMNTTSKCPLCRSVLSVDSVSVIDNYCQQTKPTPAQLPSKEQAIMKILNMYQGKFLIYSAHEQSFVHIEEALKSSQKQFTRLLGSISRVNVILNRYRNGDLDILMLNATHYGTGLNLENTTDLIFYHSMSPDMEKQVIGRAQRAGRTQPLRIHYLYQENEINHA